MQGSTTIGRVWARRLAGAVLVALLVVTGCSGDDDGPEPEQSAPCGALGGLGPRDRPVPAPADGAPDGEDRRDAGDGALQVLLLTRTEGFRHDSIPVAIDWFEGLADDGVEVTATEETDAFTESGLEGFDVVAFVNTTGDVLDTDEQEVFQEWVEGGGAFVGVHAAADTEHDWEWYGDMVGGSFTSHPLLFQTAEVTNERPDHPATEHLDADFSFTEEWYSFDRNARHSSDVLLTIDESTATYAHSGEPVTELTMGEDHPVAWSRQQGDGRVFYTAMGHRAETWADPGFQRHLEAGIRWVAEPGRYRRTVVTEDVDAPVAVEVAESGLVMWAERAGAVRVWDPTTGFVHDAGTVPTRVEGEGGLMGLRLAADAAETGHLYVYATLPEDEEGGADGTDEDDGAGDGTTTASSAPDGGEAVDIGEGVDPDGIDDLVEAGAVGTNALMRVTLGPDCTLDLSDDAVEMLLEVPNQFTGHQAGDIQLMPDGTILVSTGDNTDNVQDGYAPIGGTGVPETSDARRTSGNRDDLRGKVLRIAPDGSIPDGNLSPADGSAGRPEVYLTGLRNPYRLAVHPDSGRIWFGDIGPDALTPGERGPQGFDELGTAAKPGDHGWPRCIADQAYREHDLGTGVTGDPFDCSDTVPPVLAYDYTSLVHPALGVGFRTDTDGEVQLLGRSMMAGPWYRPADDAPAALPIGEALVLHEFARGLLLRAEVDDEGRLTDLRSIAPWAGINTPIDVEVAPDGALYVIEYGQWNDITAGQPAITRLEFSSTGRFPALPDARPAPGGVVGAATETDGGALFDLSCGSCHGNDGQGGIGPSLHGVGDRLDEDEARDVVAGGRGRMPAWGDRLTDEQIDAVVAYVRDL